MATFSKETLHQTNEVLLGHVIAVIFSPIELLVFENDFGDKEEPSTSKSPVDSIIGSKVSKYSIISV